MKDLILHRKGEIISKPLDPSGAVIAIILIVAWFTSLFILLSWELNYLNPITYLAVLIQTYLYTGIFITAHDAMHDTVSKNKSVNDFFGRLTSLLFAFNSYDFLRKKHHEHHRHVASEEDPDYHESGMFWKWYWSFLKRYITIKQLILITIFMQVLGILFPFENLILFWSLPSILSTFQLFYFGTYVPHKDEERNHNKHRAGTLKKGHIFAFISCYFFGYHYEHHDAPGTPWWRLWQLK